MIRWKDSNIGKIARRMFQAEVKQNILKPQAGATRKSLWPEETVADDDIGDIVMRQGMWDLKSQHKESGFYSK